jgi:hypothetical protein
MLRQPYVVLKQDSSIFWHVARALVQKSFFNLVEQ